MPGYVVRDKPIEVPKQARACPQCGKELVIRANKNTGHQFIGCSMWPDCAFTGPLLEDVLMKAIGAPQLPGMEGV
jgi:restriction system protein